MLRPVLSEVAFGLSYHKKVKTSIKNMTKQERTFYDLCMMMGMDFL